MAYPKPMRSRQRTPAPAVPGEILEESVTRRFREDLRQSPAEEARRKTRRCPLCGANNSLTDTAARLGNLCDDCLEGDTDLGEKK